MSGAVSGERKGLFPLTSHRSPPFTPCPSTSRHRRPPGRRRLTCGGTLLRWIRVTAPPSSISPPGSRHPGQRGPSGPEAEAAARILGVTERRNAGLRDAHLANDEPSRRVVVEAIRHFAPRVVILPFPVAGIPTTGSPRSWAGMPAFSRARPGIPPTARPIAPSRFSCLVLPGGSDQAHPDGGHQRPVRAQAGGHSLLREPVRRAVSAGEIFPTGQDLYSRIEHQNATTASDPDPLRRAVLHP